MSLTHPYFFPSPFFPFFSFPSFPIFFDRPGKFQAQLIITPLDLPGATPYVVPLIAYGESVDLVLNNLDPFDFGVVPYGVKKVLKKVLTNTGRIKTSFTVSFCFFLFFFCFFFVIPGYYTSITPV